MSTETSKKQIEDLLLNFYHKGHELSDGELYRPMLHDNFSIFWINNGKKIESTDKEDYISWYEAENRNTKLRWQTDILSIDVEGDIASAKVRIYNQNFGYLDYFNFMRENGKWFAVNKISKKLKEI